MAGAFSQVPLRNTPLRQVRQKDERNALLAGCPTCGFLSARRQADALYVVEHDRRLSTVIAVPPSLFDLTTCPQDAPPSRRQFASALPAFQLQNCLRSMSSGRLTSRAQEWCYCSHSTRLPLSLSCASTPESLPHSVHVVLSGPKHRGIVRVTELAGRPRWCLSFPSSMRCTCCGSTSQRTSFNGLTVRQTESISSVTLSFMALCRKSAGAPWLCLTHRCRRYA